MHGAADHALRSLTRESRAARLSGVPTFLILRCEVHVEAFNINYDLIIIVWRAK